MSQGAWPPVIPGINYHYHDDHTAIICGDCLDVLPRMAPGSVDLVLTDPPYYRVKSDDWDRQWKDRKAFLEWVGALCGEWQRLLKPNGSLYVFASPQMAAWVEVTMAQHFNVLNRIAWAKKGSQKANSGQWSRADKDTLRAFFPQKEEIVFAEHHGADSMALGESGYAAQCERLRGFVFEPLRLYLAGEWKRAGLNADDANQACGTVSMAGKHYFTRSQWCLPTAPHYAALQRYAHGHGRRPAPPYEEFHEAPRSRFERGPVPIEAEYLRAEYEDLRRDYEDLRRDYEDLRRDYEDLRRPFAVSSKVPYTDVWHFTTAAARPGKHPCEKPLPLLMHMIQASSRPGAVVLDCFGGSGSTADAARRLGRKTLLIEKDPAWCNRTVQRLAQEVLAL